MARWGFYGRRTELADIERLLNRGAFFFCAISGRRRIGKTSLIQEALKRRGLTERALYVQIPDSDERGFVHVFEDAVEDVLGSQDFARRECSNFSEIALLFIALWANKHIIALDEFQCLHRINLYPFLSNL